MKNSARPRFEREDYFNSYKRKEKKANNPQPSYSSSRFDQQPSRRFGNADPEARKILAVVVVIAIIGISISVIYGSFLGLLLIFALPIIVSFIRARRETQRGRSRSDGEDSSFSN
ncbi:MAG: hypothetical protein ACYC7D_10330 [Nitrososphaerales archaeon]